MYNTWEELENNCKNCNKCNLSKTRKNVLIGEGKKDAKIIFIAEGPGIDEDLTGKIFVGKAGQLMDKAFIGLGIKREEIYITNIVKCKLPLNRNPKEEEILACSEYLQSQIKLINPEIIVLLGNCALKNMLDKEYAITKVRGTIIKKDGIKYLPTFHPAALLRDENKKIDFWQDLKKIHKNI